MRIYIRGVRVYVQLHAECLPPSFMRMCVGCENTHTIPCGRTHETFSHPMHSELEAMPASIIHAQVCRVCEDTYDTMR